MLQAALLLEKATASIRSYKRPPASPVPASPARTEEYTDAQEYMAE